MENRKRLTNFLFDGWQYVIIYSQDDILMRLCKMVQENEVLDPDAISKSLKLCLELIKNCEEMESECRPEFRWFSKIKRLTEHSLIVLEEIVYCLEIMIKKLLKSQEDKENSPGKCVK